MVQRRDQLKRGREKERRREMAKLRRRKGQTRRSREGRQPTDWAGFGEGRFGVWSWESERRSGSCRGAFVDSDRTERGGGVANDGSCNPQENLSRSFRTLDTCETTVSVDDEMRPIFSDSRGKIDEISTIHRIYCKGLCGTDNWEIQPRVGHGVSLTICPREVPDSQRQ